MHGSYGQFCPLALASEVLTQRWMLLIIRELSVGVTRFNDIRRGVPKISATLLRERLEVLERAGIVTRQVDPHSGHAEYHLTDAGRELKDVLKGIATWGQRWARDIDDDDLDPGWLVWNMHRRLNLPAFPEGRTVIALEFGDADSTERFFWLVVNEGVVEVCLKDPGFPVTIKVHTTVRVMAEIWRGIRDIRQEIGNGNLVLEGDAATREALPDWLLLSVYAPIKRQRTSP